MIATDFDDSVTEEVVALEATLMEDVTVHRSDDGHITGVEICVVPATAQQVSQQHVRCTLEATFPPRYPAVQPKVIIRNPRGIDENVLLKVEREMMAKCQELEGSPVIYELVELIRENLTENNTPSCPCTICLYHFHPSDHFTKTQCFHYFHKHCMGRYIKNCELTYAASVAEQQLAPWQAQPQLQLICPVCREPITLEESAESLMSMPGPVEEEGEELWSPDAPEVQALQQSMAKLFLQQQQRGGIIDLEQEKNKYFVSLIANEPHIEQDSAQVSGVDESLGHEKKDLTPPREAATEAPVVEEIRDGRNINFPAGESDGVDTGKSDRGSGSRGRDRALHGDVRGRDRGSSRSGRPCYGSRGRGAADGSLVYDGYGRGRRVGSDHRQGYHARGSQNNSDAGCGRRNTDVGSTRYSRPWEEQHDQSSYSRRKDDDELNRRHGPRMFRGGYGVPQSGYTYNSRYTHSNHQHGSNGSGQHFYARGCGRNRGRTERPSGRQLHADAEANDCSSASSSQS
ncbi:E3 ubiquitin-protein ligase RNF25 [Hyalella azteca]|uniref:E3 ubiquitin-protein ligase RNF25 n=1 Tax=Hyalella azteca TaxID=294128 RepID=A0A8B7NXV6_HYAAZ|nr:E3 ubiquitin-protein ligase RNF25 [Hyalella azteca]